MKNSVTTDPEQGQAGELRADPDSRARTHLANERTFLAWLRTGLSLVALGIAAAGFLDRDLISGVPVTTAFAFSLVASGVALIVLGGIHYQHARDQIDVGAYQPQSRATTVAVGIVVAVGLISLVFVVLLRASD